MNTTKAKFNSKQRQNDKYIEDLIADVEMDFKKRRNALLDNVENGIVDKNFSSSTSYFVINKNGNLMVL